MRRRILVNKERKLSGGRFTSPLPPNVEISRVNVSRDGDASLIVEVLYSEEGVKQMLVFQMNATKRLAANFFGTGYQNMNAARAVLDDYLTDRRWIAHVKVVHLREGAPAVDATGKVSWDEKDKP